MDWWDLDLDALLGSGTGAGGAGAINAEEMAAGATGADNWFDFGYNPFSDEGEITGDPNNPTGTNGYTPPGSDPLSGAFEWAKKNPTVTAALIQALGGGLNAAGTAEAKKKLAEQEAELKLAGERARDSDKTIRAARVPTGVGITPAAKGLLQSQSGGSVFNPATGRLARRYG